MLLTGHRKRVYFIPEALQTTRYTAAYFSEHSLCFYIAVILNLRIKSIFKKNNDKIENDFILVILKEWNIIFVQVQNIYIIIYLYIIKQPHLPYYSIIKRYHYIL